MPFEALTFSLNSYLLAILLALAGIGLLRQAFDVRLDPQEPPPVRPRIPVIDHIIGLLRYHMGYFEQLAFVPSNLSHAPSPVSLT
jgi:hypothetical protein